MPGIRKPQLGHSHGVIGHVVKSPVSEPHMQSSSTSCSRLHILLVDVHAAPYQLEGMASPTIYPVAAAIATILAAHGLRQGSLSLSGAVAAWFVGYAHLANPVKVFGVGLVFFYLAGSRATKVSFILLRMTVPRTSVVYS